MNKKIKRMMRDIERRGGVIRIGESLPDNIAEQFLEQILSCPDCCTASGGSPVGQGTTIDHLLAGRVTKAVKDH